MSSSDHPEYKLGELLSWTRNDIKLSDYRVWWDYSDDGNYTWSSAPVAGKGKQGKGKGKGKQAKGKGKGKGKIKGGKGAI